jgi:hypothetical protein
LHEKAAVAKHALKRFLFKSRLYYSLSDRICLMKLLSSFVPQAFLSVAALFFASPNAEAQADLPLPAVRNAGAAGAKELQQPAFQADSFSVPAPLPLPPEPSPFPSFPPLERDVNPPEFDLRQRVNSALILDGPNPTEEAALQLRDRARYRELKARALARPEVRSSLEAVQKARSDGELREAWRQHYARFFAAVRALDKTLEPLIAQRESEALAPLQEKLARPARGR